MATKIEWVDGGETWNPVIGCSRVSPGCQNCYAERQAARIARMHGERSPYSQVVRNPFGPPLPRWNGEVAFLPERLDQPLCWRKPRMVFVNSMSDLFHERLTNEQIAAVFGVMAAARRHTFQVLTKRAERMRDWFAWAEEATRGKFTGPALAHIAADAVHDTDTATADTLYAAANKAAGRWWPLKNVWLGVSAEDQRRADERIPLLLQCPAAVRWVSAEPLLGPIDLTGGEHRTCSPPEDYDWMTGENYGRDGDGAPTPQPRGPSVDWVVIGGESGPGARPCDLAWVRSLVGQCKTAGVAPFVKQLGAKPFMDGSGGERFGWPCGFSVKGGRTHLLLKSPKGGDPAEWPEDLRVREWPESAPA